MEERYNRNKLIDGFGEVGQEKLKSAKVLVVGAGGLGSPVLFYLVASGVGTLGIMDDDVVNESNLQRQILHNTHNLNEAKIDSAITKLQALNQETKLIAYNYRFSAENAEALLREYDFVVDCCDNYETKFLINDVCVKYGKAYSHGAVLALRGEVMTYVPGSSDYRVFFNEPPEAGKVPTSAQAGILGAIAGMVGCIQATETIKYLTGIGDLITNRILIVDGKTMQFVSLKG